MTLTIELTGDIEQRLQEQAAASGCDVPSYVRHLLADKLEEEPTVPPQPRRSHAEFMAKLREIGARHPGSNGRMDDSRESIYAGCGE